MKGLHVLEEVEQVYGVVRRQSVAAKLPDNLVLPAQVTLS